MNKVKIGIIMGSQSDWETMMFVAETLNLLEISFEKKIISAHRTPKKMFDYAESAADRGLKIIIAGAGCAAHLPGMTAALTHLPVLAVPIPSKALSGVDSLLSIVQMPAGVPTMTLAIGRPGAINAALSAASILSINDPLIRKNLIQYRENQTTKVIENDIPK